MNLFGKHISNSNKCSTCGNILDTDSLFCLKCGSPINPSTDNVADGEEKADGKKKCPGCSAMVEEESDFCWNCGYIFATLLKRCPKCNAILTSGTDKCSVCDTVVLSEGIAIEEPLSFGTSTIAEKTAESILKTGVPEASSEIGDDAVKKPISEASEESLDLTESDKEAASKYFHKPPAL